ncbi:hypothetical protein [Halorubrum sp. SP3]|uniref:hypothetical protein n=1 Tax=Halorubrum sp. SP3 TaxID=1537265 RepID=UPI002AA2B6F0|nr:hypothetical protein [Halorubrum sp. SP3]
MTEYPRGDYCIDISGVVKSYIRCEDAEITVSGVSGPESIEFAFERPHTVTVGARSLHTRPEETITVPDDPSALAEAVSMLGSSIREFSPERSWPTLRGHPPRIERGEALDIPSSLATPDTGVEVVVRPTYPDVYRLSTLSYYLGAQMRTGDAPAIRLDNGYEERLPTEGHALEARVTELLRTWFFLDTLSRTEGYIPSNRYEYDAVGPELPFYPPKLANLSMSERLMEYLEVNPETVAPYTPASSTEATLRPVPEAMELLPHLTRLIAPIRVRDARGSEPTNAPVAVATADHVSGSGSFSQAGPVPAWSSLLTPTAYENRLRRQTTDRGAVRVALLTGGDERARRLRESLSTPAVPDGVDSWSVRASPDRDVVAETLSDATLDLVICDLPLYDGIVEAADGLVEFTGETGQDGLAAPTVSVFARTADLAPVVGAIQRGSVSGAAFEDALEPDCARRLVGLLAAGFPIAAAARLAFGSTELAVRFVGDPGSVVAVDRGLPAQVFSVHPTASGSHRFRYRSFLSTEALLGSQVTMKAEFLDATPFLAGTERDVGEVTITEILQIHKMRGPTLRFSDETYLQNDVLTAGRIDELARRAPSHDSADSSFPDAESECRD